MSKAPKPFWRAIGAPFRFLKRVFAWPVAVRREFVAFWNEEPADRPWVEAFTEALHSREALFIHIEGLRRHLLRMLLALIVTISISFARIQWLLDYLARPVGGLGSLQSIEVTEQVGVFMRVALLAGILLALPYLVFELWLFSARGMRRRKRRQWILSIPLATVLFAGGMAFAYYLLLPAALPFLQNFIGVTANLRANSYFSFVTGLMFWLGAVFEFPLIVSALVDIGLITPRQLTDQWRLAVVLIALLSAIITPTIDPVNMSLVMLPMIALYFVGVAFGQLVYGARKRRLAKEEEK